MTSPLCVAVKETASTAHRRFAVVLLLRLDERVVAHLPLVVSEDALGAALGGADSSKVPLERHAFKRCLKR